MSERAWTPERVDLLLSSLEYIGKVCDRLAQAEERVGDILEKALTAPPNGKAEEVVE